MKHIAPITSMTITGASPSNPSNGGTTSIPCGTGSFTVSVPTPVTDPVATVTYSWIKPSTWAGASTTNSITMTPDAGATDGTISVQAKRADGTVVQTYTVAFVRPRVTNAIITSVSWSPDDKPMCSSATRQLSGASTANATVFNWTTTGGISVVSGGNQSIATFSGTSNGQVTLTASNACAASNAKTWKVFAQTPQVVTSDVLVDGHSNNYPNYTSGNSTISVQNGSACQSYKWEIYGGSGYINPNYGGCGFSYNGITFNHGNFGSASTSSSMAIRLRTANDCGQGVDVIIPLQTTGGGYYRMTSPNPTTNTISLALDDALPRGSLKKINVVSDTRATIVRNYDPSNPQNSDARVSGNNISFDVSSLPRGTYYLIFVFEGSKNFKETIVVGQ